MCRMSLQDYSFIAWTSRGTGNTWSRCSCSPKMHQRKRPGKLRNICKNNVLCVYSVFLIESCMFYRVWTVVECFWNFPWKVCWMCECTKGTNDLDHAYTNISETAGWRTTIYSTNPWPEDELPEYVHLRGFHINMISIDVLHCFHLGIGRDLVGSAFKTLVGIRFWAGTSIEKSLARATVRVKNWAKTKRLALSCKALTKDKLGWSQLYPELKSKGYDTYVLLSWLVEEVSTTRPIGRTDVEQQNLDELCTCLWCADVWLRSCTKADLFLDDHQQRQKVIIGNLFISLYLSLASRALEQGKRLWRIRPKFHLFHHRVIEDRPSRLNPHATATWLDEEWIKRTMKVKKKTHKRTATEKCLKRWLLALPQKMAQTLEKVKRSWKMRESVSGNNGINKIDAPHVVFLYVHVCLWCFPKLFSSKSCNPPKIMGCTNKVSPSQGIDIYQQNISIRILYIYIQVYSYAKERCFGHLSFGDNHRQQQKAKM